MARIIHYYIKSKGRNFQVKPRRDAMCHTLRQPIKILASSIKTIFDETTEAANDRDSSVAQFPLSMRSGLRRI